MCYIILAIGGFGLLGLQEYRVWVSLVLEQNIGSFVLFRIIQLSVRFLGFLHSCKEIAIGAQSSCYLDIVVLIVV